MYKNFDNCATLDELKAAYRKAALENHPDRGGDTATMQRINAAYEARFNTLKDGVTTTKTAETAETAADFVKIIDELLRLDGLEIELCGRWLWISGNTYPHKAALKAAGCRWCSRKKMWNWHLPEDSRAGNRQHTMEEIRDKYGSRVFSSGGTSGRVAIGA